MPAEPNSSLARLQLSAGMAGAELVQRALIANLDSSADKSAPDGAGECAAEADAADAEVGQRLRHGKPSPPPTSTDQPESCIFAIQMPQAPLCGALAGRANAPRALPEPLTESMRKGSDFRITQPIGDLTYRKFAVSKH